MPASSFTGNSKTLSGVAEPVVGYVLRSIRMGEVRAGDRIGTEVELARRFRISRMSVRRAFDSLVQQEVIERRRGEGVYVSRPFAASRVIQMIVPSLTFEAHVWMVNGVQSEATASGLEVQICDAHRSTEQALRLIRHLPDRPVRGAIISSLHDRRFAETLYELKRKKYPFVLVDEWIPHLGICSVVPDNYHGGYEVGQALVKYGHRRIGFVAHLGAQTNQERLKGLSDAVNDAGLPFDRSLAMDLHVDDPLGDWTKKIDQAIHDLVQRENRPTAILCNDDSSAVVVYRTLRELGLRIPEDVSVVGHGDVSLCELLNPPLATLRYPSYEMGKQAMQLLLQLSDSEVEPRRHVLPLSWVPRASVAAVETAEAKEHLGEQRNLPTAHETSARKVVADTN